MMDKILAGNLNLGRSSYYNVHFLQDTLNIYFVGPKKCQRLPNLICKHLSLKLSEVLNQAI